MRIAVIGNQDSGKSTIIGVLTKGEGDNGEGSARVSVFNTKNEVQSGLTTSIAYELIGYTEDGQQIFPDRPVANKQERWEFLVEHSHHFLLFLDMCGH